MATQMTRRERLQATFRGDAVDRVAVGLWRHFPGDDQRPADLAAAALAWQAQYDWDFIKVSPSSSFCLVDWGVQDEWRGGDEGTRSYTFNPVRLPEDWEALPVLDPNMGFISNQLECLRILKDAVGNTVPYIQTVFSPLAQAKNLAGSELLLAQIRQTPQAVHAGLEAITVSTIRFLQACIPLGISGIYYALQFATYRLMSESEYREFGEPYDRRILDVAQACWFNMLHLHGADVMYDLSAKYPVQAINWHDRETAPSLAEGKDRFSGAVCGGLARWDDLLRADPAQIRRQVSDAIQQTGGRRLIVSSGCVAPVSAPFSNLRTVREMVEQ